jgi:alpha-amylase
MLPGTPCVFFPHWVTFKTEINTLIALRKAAGVHSESQVYDEEASASAYSATIAGHNGSVILRMGSGRDQSVPAGYFKAIQGNDFEIYASNDVVFSPVNITANENVLAEPNKSEKQLIDGHLYIRKNGCTYDATGRLIR